MDTRNLPVQKLSTLDELQLMLSNYVYETDDTRLTPIIDDLAAIALLHAEIIPLDMQLKGKIQREFDADEILKIVKQKRDELAGQRDEMITRLVSQLNIAINFVANAALQNSLQEIILVLGTLNPINDEDPITLEEIDPLNRVITFARYQFDIRSLYELLKQKDLKSLKNPLTRQVFDKADKKIIAECVKVYAQQTQLHFQAEMQNAHPAGDPDIEFTLTLARELQADNLQNSGNEMVLDSELDLYVHPQQQENPYVTLLNSSLETHAAVVRQGDIVPTNLAPSDFRRVRRALRIHADTLSVNEDILSALRQRNIRLPSEVSRSAAAPMEEYFYSSRLPSTFFRPTASEIRLPPGDWWRAGICTALPNGNLAIANYFDNRIRIVNPTSGEIIQRFDEHGRVSQLTALPNNHLVASNMDIIHIFDSLNGNLIQSINSPVRPLSSIVNINNNLILAGMAGEIKILNTSDMSVRDVPSIFSRSVDNLITDAEHFIAIGSVGTNLKCNIYNLEGNLLHGFSVTGRPRIGSVLQNGNILLVDRDSHVRVYNPHSEPPGRLESEYYIRNMSLIDPIDHLTRLGIESMCVRNIITLETGNVLINGSNGLIFVFDPADGRTIKEFQLSPAHDVIQSKAALRVMYDYLNSQQPAPSQPRTPRPGPIVDDVD